MKVHPFEYRPPKSVPMQTKPRSRRQRRLKRLFDEFRRERIRGKEVETLDDFLDLFPAFSLIEFNFKSAFSVELRSTIFVCLFLLLLHFSSSLGLSIPNRFVTNTCNTTLSTGFFHQNNSFKANFYFSEKHRKFSFFYKFIKRSNDQWDFFEHEKSYNITVSLTTNYNYQIKKKLKSEYFIEETYLTETNSSLLLSVYLPKKSDYIRLEVFFDGDLSKYSSFSIDAITYNSTYLNIVFYYRTIFLLFGFALLYHKKFRFLSTKNLHIPGILIIMCNLPSVIFNFEQSVFALILQKLADNIFYYLLVLIWGYFFLIEVKIFPKYFLYVKTPMITAFCLVFMLVLARTITSCFSEYDNAYDFIHNGIHNQDLTSLKFYGFVFAATYLLFVFFKGTAWMDMTTFIFFAAQICHLYDEVFDSWRIAKCMSMGMWMRHFTGIIAMYFIFKRKGETESSEKILKEIPLSFDLESRSD